MDISSLTPKRMRKSKNGKQGTRYYDDSSQLVAKTCSTCDNVKQVEDFSPAKAQSDGLFSKCRTCSSEYQKQYRENGPVSPQTKGRSQYSERTDEEIQKLLDRRFPEGVKKCTSCLVTRPLDSFYINKSNPSTISSRCKDCAKRAARNRAVELAENDPEYYTTQYEKYKKI